MFRIVNNNFTSMLNSLIADIDEDDYLEHKVEEWLDRASSKQFTSEIKRKIRSETKESLQLFSKKAFGFSFHGLNDIRQSCLKSVRELYTTEGIRPRVADIGAGLGNMTWKLLAAGATVDAFEQQEPLTKELKRRLSSLNQSYWNNNKLDDILTIHTQNAFEALLQHEFKGKYDFIWIGNVIHFLPPKEIKNMMRIFKQILKPGGRVYAELDTPDTIQSMKNHSLVNTAIQKAEKKGLEFPTFLAMNHISTIDQEDHSDLTTTIISVWDEQEMKEYGIQPKATSFEEKHLMPEKMDTQAKSREYKIQQQAKKTPNKKMDIIYFHSIMNRLNEDVAKRFFTYAGFSLLLAREKDASLQLIMQKPTISFDLKQNTKNDSDKTESTRWNIGVDASLSLNFFSKKQTSEASPFHTPELKSGVVQIFNLRGLGK